MLTGEQRVVNPVFRYKIERLVLLNNCIFILKSKSEPRQNEGPILLDGLGSLLDW